MTSLPVAPPGGMYSAAYQGIMGKLEGRTNYHPTPEANTCFELVNSSHCQAWLPIRGVIEQVALYIAERLPALVLVVVWNSYVRRLCAHSYL